MRAHDRYGEIKETSVTAVLEEPGGKRVEVDLEKGYAPDTDKEPKSDENKPDER